MIVVRMMGTVRRGGRGLVAAGLGLLALAWSAGPAQALGPPEFTFSSIILEGIGAVLRVRIALPGGRVPADIASVEVVRPDNQVFSISLERADLAPDGSFSLFLGNLSQFGQGLSGTYRVIAADSDGGVSELQLTFDVPPVLAGATALKVPGSQHLPLLGVRTLDLAAHPTPTVEFDAVPGALMHHVVVRELSADVDAVRIEVPGIGGHEDTRSVVLPGGVMVPGRRYVLSVEAFDAPGALGCTTSVGCTHADARARSTVALDLVTLGPDVTVAVSGGLGAGQTVVLGVRAVNSGAAVVLHAVGWIGLPTGEVLTGVATTVTLGTTLTPALFDNLFSHTFTPADPPGAGSPGSGT